MQREIADIITTRILPNPQSFVEVGSVYIDGKSVITIKIKKGNALYYIKKFGRSAQGCYVRIGTSCRSMTKEQIERAFIKSLNIPKETIVEKESLFQELTFTQFKFLLNYRGVHINEASFEKNFNLRNKDGKYNVMARLLSDQSDASIKVVRFRGKDKSEFISRKEFGFCSLIKAMQESTDYALNILNIIQTNIVGAVRVDTPYFDEDAFREAWINAICHNDWVTGIPPAVYGFDDRVEIISHGLLPDDLSEDDFYKGVSRPVNKELAQILTQMHYIEQSGKGVPTVVGKYGKRCYRFGTSFIECIIPYNILNKEKTEVLNGTIHNTPNEGVNEGVNGGVNEGVNGGVNEGVNGGVNEGVKINPTCEAIVKCIRQEPYITAKQIAKQINKSKQTVERSLKSLKELKIIRRVGSDKSGYWEII